MTDVYEIIYKCRLCSRIFENGTWFGDVYGFQGDNRTMKHRCDDGRIGICDLVGFRDSNK